MIPYPSPQADKIIKDYSDIRVRGEPILVSAVFDDYLLYKGIRYSLSDLRKLPTEVLEFYTDIKLYRIKQDLKVSQ